MHLEGTRIIQELNNPLDEVIRTTLAAGRSTVHESVVEGCMRSFFEANRALLSRGAFNWDPKIENFCIDDQGRIRLCDIAGLVKVSTVLDQMQNEIECDDDYIPYAMLKLNDRVPEEARPIFHRLRDEYGFAHGGSLAKLVLSSVAENG